MRKKKKKKKEIKTVTQNLCLYILPLFPCIIFNNVINILCMDLIFFVLIICAWFLTVHLKASVPIQKDKNTDDMNKTFNKGSVSLNELQVFQRHLK